MNSLYLLLLYLLGRYNFARRLVSLAPCQPNVLALLLKKNSYQLSSLPVQLTSFTFIALNYYSFTWDLILRVKLTSDTTSKDLHWTNCSYTIKICIRSSFSVEIMRKDSWIQILKIKIRNYVQLNKFLCRYQLQLVTNYCRSGSVCLSDRGQSIRPS